MPRTDIPITALPANGATARPAGTAVDATNQHVIAAAGKMDRLIIEFTNTFAGTKACTVKAGVNPPGFRKGVGDLTTGAIAQNAVSILGPLEAARFAQADGSINVDVDASTTGTIRVYRLGKV